MKNASSSSCSYNDEDDGSTFTQNFLARQRTRTEARLQADTSVNTEAVNSLFGDMSIKESPKNLSHRSAAEFASQE